MKTNIACCRAAGVAIAFAVLLICNSSALACVGLDCGGEGDGADPTEPTSQEGDEQSSAKSSISQLIACVDEEGEPEPGQVPTVKLV